MNQNKTRYYQSNLLKDITQQHKDLVKCVREVLGEWHKFTIAIDGLDGSGKSTLARFLAWQTEITNIETDMLLNLGSGDLTYRLNDLKRLIETRHQLNRPIIIEGAFLCRLFGKLDLQPDYLIYIEKQNHEGSITWSNDFNKYQKTYNPKDKANFIFSWEE